MEKILVKTTSREELVDITRSVDEIVRGKSIKSGLCVVYSPHTTAAVTINEGADPDVASDIISGMRRLVPGDWDFRHMEGNSDAHLKATLVGPSETVLIDNGRLVLGTWQKIFFCEFDGPRQRSLYVHVEGRAGGK
jgi:secondary thiamine-phosphate synthase enzyme